MVLPVTWWPQSAWFAVAAESLERRRMRCDLWMMIHSFHSSPKMDRLVRLKLDGGKKSTRHAASAIQASHPNPEEIQSLWHSPWWQNKRCLELKKEI